MTIEFQPWPKIARLNRDIVITEKIDGTNAAVLFFTEGDVEHQIIPGTYYANKMGFGMRASDGAPLIVAAQSRKRLINPDSDNFGFAAWVRDNMVALADTLGPGRHFGEWWGSGIQRGYGLPKGEKRFSLFNAKRYVPLFDAEDVFHPRCLLPELSTVPVLYEGPFSQEAISETLFDLSTNGSYAVANFRNPEGIVVYHTAANQMFKVTLENDDQPKGQTGD